MADGGQVQVACSKYQHARHGSLKYELSHKYIRMYEAHHGHGNSISGGGGEMCD